MTENIKCSEENAYSVDEDNFDKKNFVERNFSFPYYYIIPSIVFIIALAAKSVAAKNNARDDTESLLRLLDLLHRIPHEEHHYNLHFADGHPLSGRISHSYLRTDNMSKELQSLGLIIDHLPECITRCYAGQQEANWDRAFDPRGLEEERSVFDPTRSVVDAIEYNPSGLRVSEFELLIKNTASEIGNEFTLTDVYTHFCYIYAATYNHYVIPESEDKEEHVKHLQNILYSIRHVKDHLKVEKDKKEIIVRIKLNELDTKLLEFIRQILNLYYSVFADSFEIVFYKTEYHLVAGDGV